MDAFAPDSAAIAHASYERMTPLTLAEQAVTDDTPEKLSTAEWGIAYQHLERRLGALRNWRYSWWVHWSRLAEFFLPMRYLFLIVANRFNRGNPINDQILDSTGLQAVRTCAAGMLSGLMSPLRPWFTLEIGLPWIELDAEGKAWLEDTQEKAYTILDESNFYTVMAQAFQDVTVFGTAPVIVYEDSEDVIRAYGAAPGEYYLGVGARQSINTFYREFTFNVGQIVEFVGDIKKTPTVVREMWNAGQLDAEYVVAHSIEPNFAFRGKDARTEVRLVPDSYPIREVYWLRGQDTALPLSVKGFEGEAMMVARWATVANNAYGRSPCMDALGDVKQVQIETARKAEFIEKGVRPPMLADVSLKNEPSSIIPGAINYVSSTGSNVGFKPAFEPNPAWLPALTADIEMVNARIQACLYVDLFMAITRMEGVQPRNELELTQRNQERLQELGPFVKMFQNEFAGPLLKRVIAIMANKRILKPLPKSLQNTPIKINYVSVMRLAQLALESVAMKDVLQTAGLMDAVAHSSGRPPPSRIIDLDQAMRDYVKLNNAPADLLFTIDEVTAHDKQSAQQAMAQQAGQGAMAAVQAAKTASETPLGNGSALDAMLGVGARAPIVPPGGGAGVPR